MYCPLLLASTLTPGEDSQEPTPSPEVILMGVISGTGTECPSQSSNHTPKVAAHSSMHRGHPICSQPITPMGVDNMHVCTCVSWEYTTNWQSFYSKNPTCEMILLATAVVGLPLLMALGRELSGFLSVYICNVLASYIMVLPWARCLGERGFRHE